MPGVNSNLNQVSFFPTIANKFINYSAIVFIYIELYERFKNIKRFRLFNFPIVHYGLEKIKAG